MKAVWNDKIIAESEETILVEGNHYFPPSSINRDFFNMSETTTICGWKGKASYYTLSVNGQINMDAAWYYPSPKETAKNISNYIAFWKDVEIRE
jgi:uncharacterized protein (DUF427 family)